MLNIKKGAEKDLSKKDKYNFWSKWCCFE